MRVLSVCSGIGAPECAWSPLGWQFVAHAEIEPFPSAVLAHHYPGVPNWGDMTKFAEWPDADVDVLVGGTPCQSFSVAGLRGGMADPRGNLALTYLAIADRYRPRWLVYENVPGLLSSNGGRDFGSLLGGMGQLGYGWAYRVLDAQHFGVPQRRRRVFVVGCLGNWRGAAAVLFERESLSGHPAPSREAGKGVADGAISRALTSSHTATGRLDPNEATFIPVAHSLRAKHNLSHRADADTLVPIAFQTRGSNLDVGEISGTMGANADRASGSAPMVAFSCKDHGADAGDMVPTLRAMGHSGSHANAGGQVAATTTTGVRRILPVEAEKLQGFPLGWTNILYRGKPAADGPRYRALGNSMAVPVVSWIGRRIQMVDDLIRTLTASVAA